MRMHASWRSGTSGRHRVVAKHSNSRAILRATQRHHVLANVSRHNLTVLRIGVCQDPLDKIVSELVAGDVDEWHTWAIRTSLADAVQVLVQEVVATNLETLLDDLRGVLIHAVLSSIAENVVDSTSLVDWSSMFADVLDAPIAKLAMRDAIDVSQNFVDASALGNKVSI